MFNKRELFAAHQRSMFICKALIYSQLYVIERITLRYSTAKEYTEKRASSNILPLISTSIHLYILYINISIHINTKFDIRPTAEPDLESSPANNNLWITDIIKTTLKLTYGNLGSKNFPGEKPPDPDL
jgi:hypothetical protein